MQVTLTEIDRKAISELKFFSANYEDQHNRAIAICNDCIDKIRANTLSKDTYFSSSYVNNKWRVEARKLHRQYNKRFGVDEYVPGRLTDFALDELADELKEMYQEDVFRNL